MSDDFGFFLLLISNGVLVGLMYSLIALGFVLVYKATDAINFAQGEFVMIAGFVAASALVVWGAPLWLAVLLALGGLIAFGFVLERVMLRKLIGRPVIAVVMATIGLASILRGVGPFVIFSGTKPLPLPIREEPFILGPLFLPPIQLLGAGVSLAFLAGFGWFFLKSRKGIAMRAVADNQQVAMAMGIDVERYFGVAWAMTGVVSALGGILWGNLRGGGREPRPGRLQGVSGGDPGRARLDPRRDHRRPDRGHRRERGLRLRRPLRRRRYQGLRALRADDHGADGPAVRHLRQEDHREDLT